MRWWQIEKRNADLERELQSDIELEEEERRENGRSQEEARHAARRALGNMPLIKEQAHEAWGVAPIERLFRDLRFAWRILLRSPIFALTAILTLAFGIGITTAVFSIVEGVLLRPLPFPEPNRLVTLGDRLEGVNYGGVPAYVTAPGASTYLREARAFTNLGAYQTLDYELSASNNGAIQSPDRVHAARLTAGIFPTLGVSATMGRVFTGKEDEGSQRVAVLSYQTWRSRFHSDPGILGTKILLGRQPYEIIGVMPSDFEFPLAPGQLDRTEIWVPMSFTQSELLHGAGNWGYRIVGRLKQEITPGLAQQDAEMLRVRSWPICPLPCLAAGFIRKCGLSMRTLWLRPGL